MLTKKVQRTIPLALIVGIIGVDLITDFAEHRSVYHIITEGVLFSIAFLWLLPFWLEALRTAQKNKRLQLRLKEIEEDAKHWKKESEEILPKLGTAISSQFERWHLSPAQREIGLLLLKGLSFKEIADRRHVSERTVRQQAQEVYAKAGMHGRAELSAYFMSDLILPEKNAYAQAHENLA